MLSTYTYLYNNYSLINYNQFIKQKNYPKKEFRNYNLPNLPIIKVMKDNNQTYQSASVKNKKISQSIRSENDIRGFAKVVAGGRIIRLRKDVPFYERLVTGFPSATNEFEKRSRAILDSVSSNLEAGLNMVDRQETFLAKIGGRLSEMAPRLTKLWTLMNLTLIKSRLKVDMCKQETISASLHLRLMTVLLCSPMALQSQ